MSEVKRFDLCGYGGGLIEHPDGAFYHMDDFDRVTAERDALQVLLTAADELSDESKKERDAICENYELLQKRADVLEGLLRRTSARLRVGGRIGWEDRSANMIDAELKFRCLACGHYHAGSGNLRCPNIPQNKS